MSRPTGRPGDAEEPADRPRVPAGGLGPGWRLALLLWLGAFVFLLLYELVGFVTGLLRRTS
jgi:hypothetical protein